MSVLHERRWDAVIDTSGYLPRVVRASAELLADAVDHYTFVSTLSVYAEPIGIGTDEGGTLGTLTDETVEEVTGETYGPLKVLCEQAVEHTLPGRTLVIRPGLIVGPHDPTDRFTYWPRRVAQGGEVLAPGTPAEAVQFIDARDLAEWTVHMVEQRAVGVYNADGPQLPMPLGQLLDTCRTASDSDARFTWVDERFLLDREVAPWSEIPLWLPAKDARGFFSFDCRKAIDAGLSFRSIEQTVRDTLAWDATRPADTEHRAGLAPKRERQLLAEWHAKEHVLSIDDTE